MKLHSTMPVLTLFLQEPSCTKVILPQTSRVQFIQEFGLEDDLAESFQTGHVSKVESLPKGNILNAGDTKEYFNIDKMLDPKQEVEENTKWLLDDVKEEDFKKESETYKSEYKRKRDQKGGGKCEDRYYSSEE